LLYCWQESEFQVVHCLIDTNVPSPDCSDCISASVTVVLTVVGIERLFFLNVKGRKITKGVINHVGMVSSILLLLI
jgi:hypothetical protein